jgi:NitT/TauT family transport system substrate-binding protein
MQRRRLLVAGAATLAAPAFVRAQAVEKPKLTLAVGGKNLLYYLPLTIAESLGYFKAEGVEPTIVDFAGGSQALRAVVGGSADVVSGAFEHTLNMQAKGQKLRAFVLQGRAPQIVLGVNPKTMPNYKSVADLKGKKIGVTAPGLVDQRDGELRARQGPASSRATCRSSAWAPSNGAVAAMRSGQIDAISNLDPVITLLQRSGDLKIVADTRIVAEADKIFGGPMPGWAASMPRRPSRQEPRHDAGAGHRDRARGQVDPGCGPGRHRQGGARELPARRTAPCTSTPFLASKGALSPTA